MKLSNADWLGRIPENWDVARISDLYKLRNEKVSDIDYAPLSVTMQGIVPQLATAAKTDDHNNRKLVKKGDFVINSRSDRRGSCGISSYDGSVSLINTVLTPRGNMNPDYYNWLFHTEQFADEFYKWGHGIVDDLWTTRWQEMKSIIIVAPPIEEQQSIANYLDDRCSKIDAIIAEAKASIEEYKELKQAVITQAVTLGIKKNRPLKDTNILWIGKTPCDWQLAELKFFASIKSGITLGQKYPAGAKLVEMPYLRVANVQGEYVDLSDVKTIQVLPEEVDKYRLEAGVVLMTEGGDRDKLGRGCVWHGEITPCLHQNHIFALTTKSDKLLPEYFSHVTTSEVARCYFDYTAKKTTNLANTNSSTIMNFRLPIPPLEEQREIVQYLDKRIKTLNDMISEKQSLIEDLEAYKKSLIYEVVTGKRKVVA